MEKVPTNSNTLVNDAYIMHKPALIECFKQQFSLCAHFEASESCTKIGRFTPKVCGLVKERGSEDFWQFMALNNYRLVKNYGGHKDEAALHMHQEARHRVMQFLLSRFLLLNTLIMEALKCEGGWCPSDHRLLWVLLQVRPTDMLEDDASKELFEALRIASVEDLEVQIKEEYSKLKLTGILDSDNHPVTGEPMYQPLYCFLDEI